MQLPPMGKSDLNLVLLTSNCIPIVKQQHVTVRNLKKDSQEAGDELRECFESTDWNALFEPHGDDMCDRLHQLL